MKRKPDWADKVAVRICDSHAVGRSDRAARALRAAEKRGFKRAVKLLREQAMNQTKHWSPAAESLLLLQADWLEEQERK